MTRHFKISGWAVFTLTLALGWALTVGMWIGQGSNTSPNLLGLEELKLKAAASHGTDTFAIATGPVDEETEGLFTLDFVTGDLQCFVIGRQGAVAARFYWNVNDGKTFGAKRGKKPNYLLTTGAFTSSPSAGGKFANTLCYVVDANSGEVAAFGFPWNKSQVNAGGALQPMAMVPIQKWATRGADVGR